MTTPKQEPTPGPLLERSAAYWEACTLHAGVRLDVFSVISGGALAADEVARRVGGDVRGVTTLLDALAAMGLLEKDGDAYRNTETAALFLDRASPRYVGHIIRHHHYLVESWSRLPEAVLGGRPVRDRDHRTPEQRESFLMGMFNLAMGIAPRLCREIDIAGRRRLLDLGGGPGTYAIHFCLANPELHAVVFDLPTTEPFARRTIERFGVADRVTFRAGDFLRDDLGGPYDVAWISHVLHSEGPAGCRRLLRKVASALEPGGLVLVHEFILDDHRAGPLFPALFSLNMLLGTPEGRSYTETELVDMLAEAGAADIRRLPFAGPNQSGIVAGRLPG
ncbi:methyltransferase [Dissulfurirhabdus thermomarina]|uniref:Methyltransferase n=1 Tax=Dissulfurirhabdus thermomarina TaxID=1765737 RepID=A0A6N9TPS7_DISTH|nr:methyltransferase [Dissulfurirhabdus thermomarina]NDY41744.1 methyltransferase [Dissulfurirhabdus thermomarina]NMX23680.1 methyltransferase [Dissulfurirhabdus thermomarina]